MLEGVRSFIPLLHGTGSLAVAQTVYESPFLLVVNRMMMLQTARVLDAQQGRVSVCLMYDGGANLALLTEYVLPIKVGAYGKSS